MVLWTRLSGQSGHDAAYSLLSDHFGGALPPICRTDRGKPYFPNSPWHFSISHTSGHAFCCVCQENVGMDCEEIHRQIPLSLGEKILSPTEYARFSAAEEPRLALLRLWVLKEALAKLSGRGWGSWLKHTDFSPDDERIQVIDGCFVAVLKENNYAV